MKKKIPNLLFLFLYGFIQFGCALSAKNLTQKSKGEYNILLISIDTLRADHLGVYGYHRNTSPNIDAFAKKSIVFENAFANTNTTTASHMTMFTGLYPTRHNVVNPGAFSYEKKIFAEVVSDQLDEDKITLAEYLKEKKYHTAWFASGMDPWLAPSLGFFRGFNEIFSYGFNSLSTAKLIARWIKKNKDKKFFAFIHSKRPHSPYTVEDKDYLKFSSPDSLMALDGKLFEKIATRLPENFLFPFSQDSLIFVPTLNKYTSESYYIGTFNRFNASNIKSLIDFYDNAIFSVDHYLGEVFQELKDSSLLENTIVILTSDHGEEFMEHGALNHHLSLNREVLHVPLIIYHPEYAHTKSIVGMVQLADIFPTVKDFLRNGNDEVSSLDGKSVLSLINGKNKQIHDELYAFQLYAGMKQSSIMTSKWKYIEALNLKKQLYDIQDDLHERNNLINDNLPPGVLENLSQKVGRYLRGTK